MHYLVHSYISFLSILIMNILSLKYFHIYLYIQKSLSRISPLTQPLMIDHNEGGLEGTNNRLC